MQAKIQTPNNLQLIALLTALVKQESVLYIASYGLEHSPPSERLGVRIQAATDLSSENG